MAKPVQEAPVQKSVQKNIQKNVMRHVSYNRQTVRNYNALNKATESESLHIGQVNIVVKSTSPDIPGPVRKSEARFKAPKAAPTPKTDNRRYRKRF